MDSGKEEPKLSVKINGNRTVTKRDEKFTVYRIVSGRSKNASSVCVDRRPIHGFLYSTSRASEKKT